MSFSVGDVVGGDFRIEQEIGRGGFGVVYRAHQLSLARMVAVKALIVEGVKDPEEALKFFEREAKAVSALRHPQIIEIYTMGIHEGVAYFSMEWLNGESLHAMLKREGVLPEAQALKIVEQIAKPLGKAHAENIVHRDLKPENIFIMPDGQIKLIDFGLAKHFGDGSQARQQPRTATGFIKGTANFMAPEQAAGQPIDHRADLYAVGVVLYQLLTCRLPYDDREFPTFYALLGTIAAGIDKPIDVRVHRREISEKTAAVVRKAMAFDAADRFQSAAELERVARDIALDRARFVPATPDARTIAAPIEGELPTRISQSGSHEEPTSRLRMALIVGGLLAFGLSSALVGAFVARRGATPAAPATIAPTSPAPAPSAAPAPAPTESPASTLAATTHAPPLAPTGETKKIRKRKLSKSTEAEGKKAPAPDSDEPRFGGR